MVPCDPASASPCKVSPPNLRLHSASGWLYPPGGDKALVPRGSNGALVVAIRLRIGTRKSAMALAQTEEIARRLAAVAPDVEVEIVKFETPGDRDQTSKLLPHGGKLDNSEMQRLADGGEVGPADALIMARAGLERVGLAHRIAYEFSIQEMLPAVGQGIVAVECAINDWETRRILSRIDDPASHKSADAEREVLWVLNGHCNSPIAGFSTIQGTQMSLTASVLDEAGKLFIEASRSGPANRPRELGRAVGLELLAKGAAAIIERSRPGIIDAS